jgi:UDP-GlcNAc:undecaprenyl-phosphate/decaprenyl-phosphate GlcNAc-1-phosphate transferase
VRRAAGSRLVVLAGTGAAATLAARGAYALLRRYPPAGEKTWVSTNHRGELVTLLEGPAVPIGAVAAQVAAAAVAAPRTASRTRTQHRSERTRACAPHPRRRLPAAGRGSDTDLPAIVAGLGALGFGVLDDLKGSGKRRGLRGHLGALAHGEVTTGAVKLAGLAVTGVSAALLDGGDPADLAINSALIAGSANLLNLFDLRPGRALKVAVLAAGLIAAGGALAAGDDDRPAGPGRLAGLTAVAAPAGAALALLPEDLGERAMLGDAGANALGALLGLAAARALPRRARAVALTVIVALTVASEKVSFTKVIAATPPLRWLDELGRRPAPTPSPGSGPASATAGGPHPARRQPGRHRRAVARVSGSRSGAWVLNFRARRER